MENNSENNGQNNGRDQKGKFLPGNSGKPFGSTKNRLRDQIKSFIGDNWINFPEWFGSLKPKEKIECLLSLLPYAVPRLQSINMTDSDGNDLSPRATIDYTKLSPEALKEVLSLTTIENGND